MQSGDLHNGFPMDIYIQKEEADPSKTAKKIVDAIKILEGNIPSSNPECVFCNYRKELEEII